MTACSECGGPLDPDVTHPQHEPGCRNACHWGCSCPEVCAACCTDPDCALREPQKTTMTDLQPLSDDEVAAIKARYEPVVAAILRSEAVPPAYQTNILRLVATVEQARSERDAAYACIRRYYDGWDATKHVEGLWAKDSLRFEQWEPMSPAEVDAIRRAQTTQEETSHD